MAKLEHEPTSQRSPVTLPPGFTPVRDLIQTQPSLFVAAFGEPLFAVGSNIQLFGDPHARADLLALDPAGVAVVVVVERDGEHWLLEHGLMCAGMVAGWKSEYFFRYPGVNRTDLESFLQVPAGQVNRKQRVVLVAHSHDYAVFSAAGWLAQRHGIEIVCVRGEIEPDSGRLIITRGNAAEAAAVEESRVEIEPVVFPPSTPTVYRERYIERDPGSPHEPALDPITPAGDGVHRLQVIWRPEPEAIAAHSIEERVEQIIREQVALRVEEVRVTPPLADESAGAVPAPVPEPAQETPRPNPVASEKRWIRFFRMAGICLICAGLIAAAVWILSTRQPSTTSLPATVAAPASTPANTGAQGSLRKPEEKPEGAKPVIPVMFGGTVLDQATGRPIPRAKIYYAGLSVIADDVGQFSLTPVPDHRRFFVKASGYRQTDVAIDSKDAIRLKPMKVHAFYLSHAHVADKTRRETILQLIRETSANAVVLGVKDVTGQVNVAVDSRLAAEIGSTSKAATIQLARQVAAWKREGIYTIGLITLFKDDLVAKRKPEWALRSLLSRRIIKDPDGISWINPAIPEVREYNIAVAKAAAAAGFDEIQFDFTRFPAEPLSQEGGGAAEYERRLETIVEFLRRAKSALAPYNVYVGSSVFGSVCTLQRAGVIGQKIEEFAEQLDYISPMLYPSYFEPAAKYPVPLKNGYQLVYDNLLRAVNRLHGNNRSIRPWLQNFPDRSSPNVPLNSDEIHGQVKAVADARASGWMLWDARNQYLNTSEAVQRVNSKAADDKASTGKNIESSKSTTGAAPLALPATHPPAPPASTGFRFSVVVLLLLAACCLAVIYASARAAWLFRRWTQQGPSIRTSVVEGTTPAGRRWLSRPEWFGGLPQARPR